MYQKIMDDVIENCATTFEEDGVNQQTLDDIRKVRMPFSSARRTARLNYRIHVSILSNAQAGVVFQSTYSFVTLCFRDAFGAILTVRHALRILG